MKIGKRKNVWEKAKKWQASIKERNTHTPKRMEEKEVYWETYKQTPNTMYKWPYTRFEHKQTRVNPWVEKIQLPLTHVTKKLQLKSQSIYKNSCVHLFRSWCSLFFGSSSSKMCSSVSHRKRDLLAVEPNTVLHIFFHIPHLLNTSISLILILRIPWEIYMNKQPHAGCELLSMQRDHPVHCLYCK